MLRMTTKAPVALFTLAFSILVFKFQNLCKSEFQQDLLIKQELAKAYSALFKALDSAILAWIAVSCCCIWATL
jgi:hypothetical protein